MRGFATVWPFRTCFHGHRVDTVRIRDRTARGPAPLRSPTRRLSGIYLNIFARRNEDLGRFILKVTVCFKGYICSRTRTALPSRSSAACKPHSPVCVICYYTVRGACRRARPVELHFFPPPSPPPFPLLSVNPYLIDTTCFPITWTAN